MEIDPCYFLELCSNQSLLLSGIVWKSILATFWNCVAINPCYFLELCSNQSLLFLELYGYRSLLLFCIMWKSILATFLYYVGICQFLLVSFEIVKFLAEFFFPILTLNLDQNSILFNFIEIQL